VTVEEALIALLAGVAGILLFLGLAEALDARPANQRRSSRRPRGDHRSRRHREGSVVRPGARRSMSEGPPGNAAPPVRGFTRPRPPADATDAAEEYQ
jgi:hypothetical protein